MFTQQARRILLSLLLAGLAALAAPGPSAGRDSVREDNPVGAEDDPVVLLIHGGAGVSRDSFSETRENAAREVLQRALEAGHAVLAEGGASLDAVEAAIVVLEDAPEFNAGRGSVLNSDGAVEMDASVMDGTTLQAGAVASVKRVRNPVRAARLVMEKTPHVLLIGEGAESLAQSHDLTMEAPDWFVTPRRRDQLQKVQQEKGATGEKEEGENESRKAGEEGGNGEARVPADALWMIGTVGAVARDREGRLAAGTSTGGLVDKLAGRVGDSPIIGAGTYAEDGVCAVSGTGVGEYYIRNVIAHEVAARIVHAGAGLDQAVDGVLRDKLEAQGGRGGLIALDPQGRISARFANTDGMAHAWITESGKTGVAFFEETVR